MFPFLEQPSRPMSQRLGLCNSYIRSGDIQCGFSQLCRTSQASDTKVEDPKPMDECHFIVTVFRLRSEHGLLQTVTKCDGVMNFSPGSGATLDDMT
jgi:hypothetical protein